MSNNQINEATGTAGSGSFRIPLSPGVRLWDKTSLDPFNINVSKYDDAQLGYDSYDGSLDVSKKTAKKRELRARKIEKYEKNHPNNSDNDGDNLNGGNGPKKPVRPYNKIVKEWVEIKEDTSSKDVINYFNNRKNKIEILENKIREIIRKNLI
jgi:hypothetical protein